jgi:hypothetical protein
MPQNISEVRGEYGWRGRVTGTSLKNKGINTRVKQKRYAIIARKM